MLKFKGLILPAERMFLTEVGAILVGEGMFLLICWSSLLRKETLLPGAGAFPLEDKLVDQFDGMLLALGQSILSAGEAIPSGARAV